MATVLLFPARVTARTIVEIGLAVVVLVVIVAFVVDLIAGPFYSLSTTTWPAEPRGTKLIGGIESTVKGADPETRIVRVASGYLGLMSLPLVVTDQTVIVVKGKLGSFGDVERYRRVRVAYEVFSDRLVATRLDLLDRDSEPADPRSVAEADERAADSDDHATTDEREYVSAPAPISPSPASAPAPLPPPASEPAPRRVRPATPSTVSAPAPRAVARPRPPAGSPVVSSPASPASRGAVAETQTTAAPQGASVPQSAPAPQTAPAPQSAPVAAATPAPLAPAATLPPPTLSDLPLAADEPSPRAREPRRVLEQTP